MRSAYSSTVFVFAINGSLNEAFLKATPSSDWGALTPTEYERICSKYHDCVIPFYDCTFSVMGVRIPFIAFEIKVLGKLGICEGISVLVQIFERKPECDPFISSDSMSLWSRDSNADHKVNFFGADCAWPWAPLRVATF